MVVGRTGVGEIGGVVLGGVMVGVSIWVRVGVVVQKGVKRGEWPVMGVVVMVV